MISTLQKVAQLNNQGALMLHDCHVEKAAETFLVAMSIMEAYSVPGQINSSIAQTVHEYRLNASLNMPTMMDSTFFMYRHPIQFLPPENECCIDEDDVAFYKAIIVFNIALVFHAKWMSTKSAGEEMYLHNALRSYEKCIALVNDLALYENIPQQLIVAATNNQAQIQYEIFDYCEAKQNLESIYSISHNIVYTSDYDNSIVNQKELKEFVRNYFFIPIPTSAGCA